MWENESFPAKAIKGIGIKRELLLQFNSISDEASVVEVVAFQMP